jgi:hypothetical protein
MALEGMEFSWFLISRSFHTASTVFNIAVTSFAATALN